MKFVLPIWLRLTVSISVALLLALAAMIVWQNGENRSAAMTQARDFANSTHQMTMAGLTGMMMTGTIGERQIFLDQIRHLDGIRDLSVARGDAVVVQFGPGKANEASSGPGVSETIRTGKVFEELGRDGDGEYLYIVKPVLAHKNYLGKNCITCHQVPEGTVLGTVSMKISLDKMNAAIADQRLKTIVAALAVLGFIIALTYLFIRVFVTRPIEEMTSRLSDIASGEGDLSHRLPAVKLDEVGRASAAFNRMMDKFSALVRQISVTAQEVNGSVVGLVAAAGKVADSSSEQRERSSQATAAVDAVANGVASIATTATQVRDQSHLNLADSERGHQNLASLVASMAAARTSVDGMVSSVREFVESTQSITSMTRQVKDIADQTNLLALNAAIEAARAGDLGRGFAVVADEVRGLAEKSSLSANSIDTVTHTITNQSVGVLKAIETGLHHLNRSQEDVAAVATILERTASGVAQVNTGVDQISDATIAQRVSSQQASRNIEEIARMADANSSVVSSVVQSARHLESLAHGLGDAVGKFRLEPAR